MLRILEEMLQADETITARAVARKHPSVQHASSITRHAGRSDLLAKYQARQAELRTWSRRLQKSSRDKLAAGLAGKDQRIAELERQVETLQVAVVAMLRAVGEMGGMSRFLQFYEGYREIREAMQRMAVLPTAAAKEIGIGKGNESIKAHS
jgi:hypothetical protein